MTVMCFPWAWKGLPLQNEAASILTGTRKFDQMEPISSLCWLVIQFRIHFKIIRFYLKNPQWSNSPNVPLWSSAALRTQKQISQVSWPAAPEASQNQAEALRGPSNLLFLSFFLFFNSRDRAFWWMCKHGRICQRLLSNCNFWQVRRINKTMKNTNKIYKIKKTKQLNWATDTSKVAKIHKNSYSNSYLTLLVLTKLVCRPKTVEGICCCTSGNFFTVQFSISSSDTALSFSHHLGCWLCVHRNVYLLWHMSGILSFILSILSYSTLVTFVFI